MANLALNTGVENVVSLYASLLQLTMIQTMTIGRSGDAQFVAANYMARAQVCCGVSDEQSKCAIVKEMDRKHGARSLSATRSE